MKPLTLAVVLTALCAPALSHAQSFSADQSSAPLTRAQVREEFIALEKAGYDPQDKTDYPSNLAQAESIVAQQNHANTGYAANTNGAIQAPR
ncbi:conserved exported hypothetical protein [Paraburkholderia piptadeniae]|uniref:Purine nucleoside phosphorylase n=1 Tax=Paraburkholderia piptadeniae TaxID=1701573 RepID=A0A1N7SPF9_9BURK|nr:DUF4148 domain-containing protein [Paraburkholderia piptadeniae]SIT49268.1 conserved exported hypothetical protein [Paraburkholderia piptadeniae]